jgi:hypothetical protein
VGELHFQGVNYICLFEFPFFKKVNKKVLLIIKVVTFSTYKLIVANQKESRNVSRKLFYWEKLGSGYLFYWQHNIITNILSKQSMLTYLSQ